MTDRSVSWQRRSMGVSASFGTLRWPAHIIACSHMLIGCIMASIQLAGLDASRPGWLRLPPRGGCFRARKSAEINQKCHQPPLLSALPYLGAFKMKDGMLVIRALSRSRNSPVSTSKGLQ
jgi:hypothetical protein